MDVRSRCIESVYCAAESFIFAELSTPEFQIYWKDRGSKHNLVANSFKFTESQERVDARSGFVESVSYEPHEHF
jgi:hypothetical protein